MTFYVFTIICLFFGDQNIRRLFFSTLVRILLALEKAGNLSFGHFYLSFFDFCPEFFAFFTEIPSIFAGNMGFQENIPEFLEKRSEFSRKPEFYADLSFGSSVKKKACNEPYSSNSNSEYFPLSFLSLHYEDFSLTFEE